MRFFARTLTALFVALAIIVIATFLWLRFTQPTPPLCPPACGGEEGGASSTSHFDSTSTAIPSTTGLLSRSDSTSQTDIQPRSAMGSTTLSHETTGLVIPVVGVTGDELVDTYTQARSNGRTHDAIDIMAPHNSPVIAAATGRIVRFFESQRGGTTIYELSPGGDTVYYYAHLDRYADGLTLGMEVRQGQLLGYVGDTGDAAPGNYHLHFAIWLIQDPKQFWDGVHINPYPILRHVK